jgi:hypothetical protein
MNSDQHQVSALTSTEKKAEVPSFLLAQISSTKPAGFVSGGITPIWIRLAPPGERCPYTGLSRTKQNTLILPSPENQFRPPVRSASLRSPGQKKATRLIDFASLLAHIESCVITHEGENFTPNTNPNKNNQQPPLAQPAGETNKKRQ